MNEPKYELLMYQLIIIVVVSIFLALAGGYMLGKEIGFSRALTGMQIEKPEYCTVDKLGAGSLKFECKELNMSFDSLCAITSPELKSKIRVAIVG